MRLFHNKAVRWQARCTPYPAVLTACRRVASLNLLFLLLAVTLSAVEGCAAIAAYRKCGGAGCPGDAAITADVRRLFQQHPSLQPPNQVDVQTIDHVVYLYGLVDTDMERQLAGSVAREAAGVSKVVNTVGLNNNSY